MQRWWRGKLGMVLMSHDDENYDVDADDASDNWLLMKLMRIW